jgi:sporulation protein YlmC with PRC-barrel domain
MTTGRVLDLHLQMLDRQIVDVDGRLAGKVDDVELQSAPSGAVYVSALLTGPIALGPRLGGRTGRWWTMLAQRLGGSADRPPTRIPMSHVTDIGSAIAVDVAAADLGLAEGERWFADRVVGRLPGASDRHD